MKERHTIRRNELQRIELNKFMKTWGIDNESEAYHTAIKWCNDYMKNVTEMFFPSTHDMVLLKKKKTYQQDKRIY